MSKRRAIKKKVTRVASRVKSGLPRAIASAYGGQSSSEERVRRILPWAGSIALHLFLVIVAMIVTWTVVVKREEPPPVIVADFESLAYDPIATIESPPVEAERVETGVPEDLLSRPDVSSSIDDLLDVRPEAPAVEPTLAPPLEAAQPIAAAPLSASFVGLSTSNARRIVYVIDASGSMMRALPVVLQELQRSLERLSPAQSFGLVFFQRNEALVAPPQGRLSPANRDVIRDRMEWISENVIPEGRSNPLAALQAALDMKPDVIFLLSENITGAGEFEIDQSDLLAFLNDANPRERSSGRRRLQINCIQFLDPDPLDTLKRIADEHGGDRGYKFLDRQELGLGSGS